MNELLDLYKHRFVAVLGLHSSGSSCLAGVLYHLGLHLGNRLTGFYGNDPSTNCGFEAIGLCQICEASIPFMSTGYHLSSEVTWDRLEKWIREKQFEASEKGTIAGGKYPQLCRLGPQLIGICGKELRVVVSNRPLAESIQSLHRRCPDTSIDVVENHQRWLEEGKQWILSHLDDSQKLIVDYGSLLKSPQVQAERIAEFLHLSPTEDQLAVACNWVDPEKCHVMS